MNSGTANGRRPSSSLVTEIVETLEACGVSWDDYQLYNVVDVEAAERLMDSGDDDVEIRFAVEGILLSIKPSSVDVLLSDYSGS